MLAPPWEEPARGRRGPKPRHTREQIVRAAIAIADAKGLAALSMESLAQRLRMSTMAAYRHIAGKAELVAIMVDEGLGKPPHLRGGWRARLTRWARAMEGVMAAHPWSIEATARRRAMGPNELAWLEAGMASLRPTRLSVTDRYDACLAIVSIVRTRVQFMTAGGVSRQAWAKAAERLAAERDYPELAALLGSPPLERRLEHSISWVLDGVATKTRRPCRENASLIHPGR